MPLVWLLGVVRCRYAIGVVTWCRYAIGVVT